MNKFLGMGLSQILALWLMLAVITLIVKVIANKYPTKGITEIVNTI